jgi:phage shock protein A
MSPITLIILIVVGAFAAAMIFSKEFRNKVLQTLRIRANDALDGATTPLEREKDEFNKLMAKLASQRAAVAKVMANARLAQKELDAEIAEVERIEREYKEAKALGASEAALNELASKFAAAELAVEEQKKIVIDANAAAEEARQALDATVKALKKFEAQIQSDEQKAALTDALKTAAEARTAASEINSSLSKAGQYHRDIEKELEEARAAAELSKGTATEQELERLREQAAQKAAREKLEGKLAGQ